MAPKICAGKADAATSPPEPKAAPKAMKVPVFSKAAADLGGYTFEQAAAAEAKENTSRPKAAAAAQAAEATPVPGTPPSVTVPGTPPLVETAALQQRPLHFGPVFEVATVPIASLNLSFLPVPKPDRRVDDCSNCHLLRCLWVWGPGSGDQSMGVYIYIHVS